MLNFLSELQEPPLHFRIFRKPFNVNQNCAMHDDKLHTVPRLELLGNLHQILFQRRDWTFGIASRYGDSENPEDKPVWVCPSFAARFSVTRFLPLLCCAHCSPVVPDSSDLEALIMLENTLKAKIRFISINDSFSQSNSS